MLDLRSLTDEELIRYCIQLGTMTPLEEELFGRLEANVDIVDPLEVEVQRLEDKLYELEVIMRSSTAAWRT